MKKTKLTKAEQRIAIAKDVLANIKVARIVAKNCAYVKMNSTDLKAIIDSEKECQLNDLLKNKTCQVCAIGSLFICALDRFNELKRKDIYPLFLNSELTNVRDILSYLEEHFSREQLAIIEKAFEIDEHGELSLSYGYLLSNTMRKAAIKFGKYYPNVEKRLAAIMRNIIRHSGQFRPELAALR